MLDVLKYDQIKGNVQEKVSLLKRVALSIGEVDSMLSVAKGIQVDVGGVVADDVVVVVVVLLERGRRP